MESKSEVVPGLKGQTNLCLDGFVYSKTRTNVNTIRWRCANRGRFRCNGEVSTSKEFPYSNPTNFREHSHPPNEIAKEVLKVRRDLRYAALKPNVKPIQALVTTLVRTPDEVKAQLCKLSTVQRDIRRQRQRILRPRPKKVCELEGKWNLCHQLTQALPPVRRPKLAKDSPAKKEDKNENTKKRLTSYDYSSWDKFDVDKACEEIDNEDIKIKVEEEDSEEIAAQEEKYLKEKALYEKDLGNKHVKANKWDEAIECYTKAIEAYPKDPVFFANRALCYLKKKKYEIVESDCTASLKLDPTYVKAMLRRAAAREALDRIEDASYDLRNALKLEPNNSQALKDLTRLKEVGNNKKSTPVTNRESTNKVGKESTPRNMTSIQEQAKTSHTSLENKTVKEHNLEKSISEPEWKPCSNTIQPIAKPPHTRSKKSLKRIKIYDVGPNIPEHVCARKIQKCENLPSTSQNRNTAPTPAATTSKCSEPVTTAGPTVKHRGIFTVTTPVEDVPPPPSTSVQFHTVWSSIKGNPDLQFKFLQQIPGDNLPVIFKESLESRMFSSILETLSSEFTSRNEPVLSYLRGLTRVKRFSTLALFMSSSDKSNLATLFDHCLRIEECSPEHTDELRRLYEMS